MADYRENVVSSILCFTKQDGNSSIDSLDILTVVDHHQLFGIQKASGLQEAIGHIHSCLNTATNRHDGLLLLEKLVSQCSTDVFTNNVSTWFNLLIQVLQSHDDIQEKQLSCKILGQLINTSSHFPELTRELSSSILPKLIPSLLTATSAWQEAATQCVSSCVVNFPGPCRSFRSKIEAFIIRELDRPCPRLASIECFAVLSCISGGGSQGVKQTDGWTERCHSLLGSLHHTLSCLYEGVEADHKAAQGNGIFTSAPDTEPGRTSVLAARYKTLTECLQALLSGKYTSSVKIPGQDIVRLVCRCLAVNYKMLLARPTTDRIRLFSRLPELHHASLDLLTSLITSCKTELLPLSDLINKLYIQTLVYTHMDSVYGHERPLSTVRTATYASLRQWLRVLGSSSNLVTEEKDLVKEILHDVTPVTDTLKLSGSHKSGLDPPPAKKIRKGGYQELSGGISSYRKMDHTANSDVTVASLHVLRLFISSVGDLLKNKSYQDVLDSMISTVLEIQQNVLEAPAPYRNSECRQALYQVLLACSLQTHPKVASPLQVTLGLFRSGLQDPCVEVAYCCQEALTVCETLVHPKAPCLRGPQLTQTTIAIRSVVMEKDQNANKVTVNDNHPINIDNSKTNSPSCISSSVDLNSVQRTTSITPSSNNSIDIHSCTEVRTVLVTKDGKSDDLLSNNSLQSDHRTEKNSNNNQSEKEGLEATITESSDEADSSDVEMEDENMVQKKVSGEKGDKEVLKTPAGSGNRSSSSSDSREIAETSSVLPSTSKEKRSEKAQETKSSDIDAMLLSFVDAEPDSD